MQNVIVANIQYQVIYSMIQFYAYLIESQLLHLSHL